MLQPTSFTVRKLGVFEVIRQALGAAKAAGRDDMGQAMIAVQAIQQARPDMTAADALAAVNLVQRS